MNIIEKIIQFFIRKAPDHAEGVFPGVLPDDRPEEDRLGDIQFGELVAAADPVDWKEKRRDEWREFGIQNQNGQSSCVANAGRKTMRVMIKENHDLDLDFSSLDIYRRRFNYPDPGMYAYDLWEIMQEGAALNDVLRSDGFSEAYANSVKPKAWMRQLGETFKTRSGVALPMNDIDAVASVIQKTGKAVVLFYYFNNDEYSRETPVIMDRSLPLRGARTLRHSIAAVDYTLINGVKHLVCEDSAHFGGHSRRLISEEFHEKRCFYAGYPMNFVFGSEDGQDKITHNFKRDIPFGEQSEEVVVLQKCLRSAGHFPTNVNTTGYYGAVTAKAVLEFQKKHGVASPGALERLAGRNVGPATREALNKIFS